MSSKRSNKQNSGRKKKRMPPNKNKHTKKLFEMETSGVVNLQFECSSSKKLQTNGKGDNYELDNDDYFILFNFSILKSFIAPMLCCPECHSHIR